MEDMQTVIILMTAVIVVHSVAIIILFSIIISLLVKLKRIASQAETAAHNIAQATEWLSPRKVFTEAYSLRYEDGHQEEGELKEKEGSFKFVSDVTKGKGKEMNLKMNMDTYSNLYELDNDTYVNNIDSININSMEMDYVDVDTIATDEEDSLLYDDGGVLCKAQNVIDVKMDKKSWLEKYENTVTINYPNGIGTIYQVVKRRKN